MTTRIANKIYADKRFQYYSCLLSICRRLTTSLHKYNNNDFTNKNDNALSPDVQGIIAANQKLSQHIAASSSSTGREEETTILSVDENVAKVGWCNYYFAHFFARLSLMLNSIYS